MGTRRRASLHLTPDDNSFGRVLGWIDGKAAPRPNGYDVTVLGFGGASTAGEDVENIRKVLNSALDAGINVIDTAECYEGSEESIGNAISKRRAEFSFSPNAGIRVGSGPRTGRAAQFWKASKAVCAVCGRTASISFNCMDVRKQS